MKLTIEDMVKRFIKAHEGFTVQCVQTFTRPKPEMKEYFWFEFGIPAHDFDAQSREIWAAYDIHAKQLKAEHDWKLAVAAEARGKQKVGL